MIILLGVLTALDNGHLSTLSIDIYNAIHSCREREREQTDDIFLSNAKPDSVKASGCIDGFQTPINHPTSGGQVCTQEAGVQQTFHLERNSFFHLSALMVRTQRSAYYM